MVAPAGGVAEELAASMTGQRNRFDIRTGKGICHQIHWSEGVRLGTSRVSDGDESVAREKSGLANAATSHQTPTTLPRPWRRSLCSFKFSWSSSLRVV